MKSSNLRAWSAILSPIAEIVGVNEESEIAIDRVNIQAVGLNFWPHALSLPAPFSGPSPNTKPTYEMTNRGSYEGQFMDR